jgi:hypothetical protein
VCEKTGVEHSELTFNLASLLDSTAEKARFEERRLIEEKANKQATIELLEETEKKNRLLQEVLEASREMMKKMEKDFVPIMVALEQKVNVLVSIQGLLVQYMVPKSKDSDKTVRILADLVKEVRGGHVNITADSVSAGSDLNVGSSLHKSIFYEGD